ncbi:MAG: hypothetical protein JWR35_2064 [Marmoricola sp.]|nr:hypothetical protein [Marmoricola sp.]
MSDKLVSESIEINAPAKVVFAILADPRQHSRIDGSGTVRGMVSGPDRLSSGAHFRTQMKMFGAPYRMKNWVVDYDEDRSIAWKHIGPARWGYALVTEGDTTIVTETFDYSRASGGPLLMMRSLRFPTRNREGIRKTLARLKAAAESDAVSK